MDRQTLSIDELPPFLIRAGILPARAILDGSFSIRDVSSRNRNHRAVWNENDGALLKQPGPGALGAARTLRNEIGFYEACSRAGSGTDLPIVDVLAHFSDPPLLALRLWRGAKRLADWRDEATDPSAVYRALGTGLAKFHGLSSSESFAKDTYAKALPPATPSWVTSLHKPSPAFLFSCTPAHLETLRIIQEESNLGENLEKVQQALRSSSVIHGDLKCDNLLVDIKEGETRIAIIDWELAQRGDLAWDIGAVLQDALAHWLEAIAPKPGPDAVTKGESSEAATRFTHAACRAFWDAYVSTTGLGWREQDELLLRAVRCSAAHLVKRAYDAGNVRRTISNHSVSLLQVAVNLFAEPAEGSAVLYGLPLSGNT